MVIFDLPFFFRDLEDVISLQDSYLGQAILGSVNETGLVGLAYWNNGLNRLFSYHPIENLSSLKQIQLWTQAVPSVHPTVLALGASPLSFSPQDGLAAITAGQIDAADLPVVSVASQPYNYDIKQVLDVGYRPE